MKPAGSFGARHIAPLAIALALAAWAPPSADAALEDGTIVGKDTAEEVKALLPPEIYQHYARGEYQNRYFDLKRAGLLSFSPPPPFVEATSANRGRYKLTAEGSIVRADGSAPGAITGFPFPDIDPTDPQVGLKIAWNYFFGWWSNGNGHFHNEVVWVNRQGPERSVTTDTKFLYYQGTPAAQALRNPEDLLLRQRSSVLEPADLQGTTSLSWRFRAARERDQSWVYVPALRRVRAVSPANRSDGFLGSDLSQDDGQYFDGKPEDFEWKVVGEQEMLALGEESSFRGEQRLKALPGGGWRILWTDKPWAGFEDPGWQGVPWAPVGFELMKRRFWVVEVVPKDRYYLYGRIVLRFDAENFKGYWSSKHDWQGNLLMSYQVSDQPWHTPDDGKTWISSGSATYQNAENLKLDRSTGVRFARGESFPADYGVPLEAGDFSPETLVRAGK